MVMASFTVTPNSSLLRLHSPSPSPIAPSYLQQFSGGVSCRRSRGSLVATRAGAPGASTYLFAFLFPLSLLAVTIFTSIQISDKLDRDFYEELAVNQSILEAEDGDGDVTPAYEEPPRQQRTRNRPKREAEISGRYPRHPALLVSTCGKTDSIMLECDIKDRRVLCVSLI